MGIFLKFQNHILQVLLIISMIGDRTSALTINNGLSLSLPDNSTDGTISQLNTVQPLGRDPNVRCYLCTKLPRFQPRNCAKVANMMCTSIGMIEPSKFIPNTWHWVDLEEGCAAGYYVPKDGYPPSKSSCSVNVEEYILEACQPDLVGCYNVNRLPNSTSNGDAIDPKNARYLIAPTNLSKWTGPYDK